MAWDYPGAAACLIENELAGNEKSNTARYKGERNVKIVADDVIKLIHSIDDVSTLPKEIRAGKTLAEQGVDSLDAMSVYLHIEEKYGIKIPDEAVDKLDSVDNIVAYLNDIL